MKTHAKTHALIALLAFPLATLSAQVSIFEREFGQPVGDVLVLRDRQRPRSLQGIQLLSLDVVGRARLTELLPSSTRRNSDIPGAARLVLPRERGSVYRYKRAEPQGGATFGFFIVDASGDARAVIELPGTGSAGTGDSFHSRIAVGARGTTLLVASSEAAGGDLWEIDLVASTAVNRTPALAPQDFERGGLALLTNFGVGVSEQGVFRFERVPGAGASSVQIPRAIATFGPDVVMSADHSTVAFLAGDSINRMLVFTCQRSGDALQASQTPMRIPGAGFLPDEPAGPHLALSTDGSWVAWRREGASSECYVSATRSGAGPSDLHVSGPAHFDDTLNDTGVIAFFDPDSFVVAVGLAESGGIGQGDLFRIDARAGGFTAANLSRTSAILQPPFDYGTLESEGLYRLPGTRPSYLGHDYELGGRLIRFDTAGTTEVLLEQVESLSSLDVAGDHIVAEVRRPRGVDDPLDDSLNLVQIPDSGGAATVLALTIGRRFSRESSLASHNLFGGVLELESGGEWLGRVSVPNPSGSSLSSVPRNYGPTTSMTPDGTLFASVLSGSRQVILSWSDLGVRTRRISPSGSFLLPGP
ncbi:MAG: hypothetical protein HOP15_17645 [Planctomycetes bacterium]|nr:hypothetical protein [Planctomycetota bacterium]